MVFLLNCECTDWMKSNDAIFLSDTVDVARKNHVVSKGRLELPRVAPYASETYAYTNSATSTYETVRLFKRLFCFDIPLGYFCKTIRRDADLRKLCLLNFFWECVAVG